jgi:hypothetical protein
MNTSGCCKSEIMGCLVLLLLFQIISINSLFCQADSTASANKKLWKFDGTFAFTLNESSFTNWVSGGENQVSTTSIMKPVLEFDNNKWSWESSMDIRHGLQWIQSHKTKKSDDVFRFESKLGRRISKNWKFSGLYTFNTQFFPSYDGEKLVSSFMAPAYTNLSLGFDYSPFKALSIYMTPCNLRSTYVLNDTISARGDFGVTPGTKTLVKFGPSFLLAFKDEVMKNILVDTKLGYFQDILDGRLADPVVNWDAVISLKVNKYIATTFTFAFFYDKNSTVDVKDENGVVTGKVAKLQFKQTFGFGLNYTW